MAAPRISKLITAQEALGSDALPFPWDAIRVKLAELLRFLASELLELAAGLRELVAALARWARAALPAAGVVVLVVVVVCCCCGYYAAGGRRRRRGPDGEEAGGGCDGPVVRYGGRCGGGYKGGIFSMHPNKPIL